jgi:hypothetical protein
MPCKGCEASMRGNFSPVAGTFRKAPVEGSIKPSTGAFLNVYIDFVF